LTASFNRTTARRKNSLAAEVLIPMTSAISL
jgi:hypothetical protein